MENTSNSVIRPPCIVKIYRGIPIKNNEYKQYFKLDELNLHLIRKKIIDQTLHKKIINIK